MTRSLRGASSSSMILTISSLAAVPFWNFVSCTTSRIRLRQSIGRARSGASLKSLGKIAASMERCGDRARLQSDGRINHPGSLGHNPLVFEKRIHRVASYEIKIRQLLQQFSQRDLPLVPFIVAVLGI